MRVSTKELKVALRQRMGSKYPLQIVKKNEEVITGFIRGFADSKSNVLMISESADSLRMRIVEVDHIITVHSPEVKSGKIISTIIRIK